MYIQPAMKKMSFVRRLMVFVVSMLASPRNEHKTRKMFHAVHFFSLRGIRQKISSALIHFFCVHLRPNFLLISSRATVCKAAGFHTGRCPRQWRGWGSLRLLWWECEKRTPDIGCKWILEAPWFRSRKQETACPGPAGPRQGCCRFLKKWAVMLCLCFAILMAIFPITIPIRPYPLI